MELSKCSTLYVNMKYLGIMQNKKNKTKEFLFAPTNFLETTTSCLNVLPTFYGNIRQQTIRPLYWFLKL